MSIHSPTPSPPKKTHRKKDGDNLNEIKHRKYKSGEIVF